MIQIQRAGLYTDMDAIERKWAFEDYLEAYKQKPTEELNAIRNKDERKTTLRKYFELFFSTGEDRRRAITARKVLEERAAQAQL